MKKSLLALLAAMALSYSHGQVVEKSPCAYYADPSFIKIRQDKNSVFSRRLEFVKKSSKTERLGWGSLKMEKGKFVPVPLVSAATFPEAIFEKPDLEAFTKAWERIIGSFYKVPVVAHIVRRSNGTEGLAEADLRASIDRANAHYFQAGMRLELCAVRYIDNDRTYRTYIDDDSSDASLHSDVVLDVVNRNVAGKLNIYCVPNAPTSWAWRPVTDAKKQHILFLNSQVRNESTFSHEVGHWFGLMHTHGGSSTELVNASNCATEGDLVCDTPADPNLSGLVNSSCAYTGTARDRNGSAYAPDPANLLSYSPRACRNRFSSDQIDIMQSVFLGVADERGFSFKSCLKTFCFTLQLNSMKLSPDGKGWKVRISGTSMDVSRFNVNFSFPFDSEGEANSALQAFRAKPSIEMCMLSGTDMYYFLHDGEPIEYPGARNFINIDPANLSVQNAQNGRFQIGNLGARSETFLFDSQDDAEQALFAMRRYRFKKVSFMQSGTTILSR
jgi:hypothetical protein